MEARFIGGDYRQIKMACQRKKGWMAMGSSGRHERSFQEAVASEEVILVDIPFSLPYSKQV